MLTSKIEQYASVGDIASPDIDLKVLLRRKVVPGFLHDVGFVAWRRPVATISLLPGQNAYDLPDDFWMMQVLTIDPSADKLKYVGDDPEKMIAASANVTPGRPDGYFITRRPTSLLYKRIQFNAPPDTGYTARFTYYTDIVFIDDTTDVEMDKYIPSQFQWGLVEGLNREIMRVRFGIGDPRYAAAEEQYGVFVERARENPELAHRTVVSLVR